MDEDMMDPDERRPQAALDARVQDPREFEDSDDEGHSVATGSFVKVGKKRESSSETEALLDDNDEEPDFYDVNVLAWDTPCSPLHFAVISGNDEAVKVLCEVSPRNFTTAEVEVS